MKRSFVLLFVAATLLILASFVFSDEQIQFIGDVYLPNGERAPNGTPVTAYLGGSSWSTVVQSLGTYKIGGPDSNFPTGTYLIRADNGSLIGQVDVYHGQGTTTVVPNIVMKIAY